MLFTGGELVRKVRACTMLLLLVTLSFAAVGCQMFDVLHPSNTWKLNRGPALDEGDAYFSVPDPLPETR